MVFFTCNHCGESVKKPAVEKHYQWKCRGAPKFVSCMDCLKDFRGEEYAAHTQCISEAEKYSGGDFVPKESKNTGRKKQDSWLEIVRSILTSENEFGVSPAIRGIFQKLQKHDNVPRKKAKFQNFVANCMKLRPNMAQDVWLVLEKALEKFHANRPKPPQQKQAKTNGEKKDVDGEEAQTNGSVGDEQNGQLPKKKKKKSKNLNASGEVATEVSIVQDESVNEGLSKKEKKKSKDAIKEAEGVLSTDKIYTIQVGDSPKKNKRQSEHENLNGSSNNQALNGHDDLVEETPKKKKKKSKSLEINENLDHSTTAKTNGEAPEVNSSKKKKKSKDKIATELIEVGKENIADHNNTSPKKKKYSEESVPNENPQENVVEFPVEDHTSSKKKKRKSKANDEAEKCTIDLTSAEKSQKDESFEQPTAKKLKTEDSTTNKSADGFDWNEEIFTILGKNNDEISLEKLKKKVLKKYKKQHAIEEIPWKIEKTFNKKIRKSGLLVENDVVKVNIK